MQVPSVDARRGAQTITGSRAGPGKTAGLITRCGAGMRSSPREASITPEPRCGPVVICSPAVTSCGATARTQWNCRWPRAEANPVLGDAGFPEPFGDFLDRCGCRGALLVGLADPVIEPRQRLNPLSAAQSFGDNRRTNRRVVSLGLPDGSMACLGEVARIDIG